MRITKLLTIIRKLEEHSEKPFDYKLKPINILDVLIATKLSQNTTDKTSYIAFTNLKKKFRNWNEVAAANINEIKECIKICGLANTKAKDIKNMLQSMLEKYKTLDLSFLKTLNTEQIYEELLQYGGIGYKTISCVLIFALGREAFPVDTHVHRVLNRLGTVNTNSAHKTFEKIKDKIPDGKKYTFHTNLIKFGRNICKSKSPLCSLCFLYNECEFEQKVFYRNKKVLHKSTENNFIILENI